MNKKIIALAILIFFALTMIAAPVLAEDAPMRVTVDSKAITFPDLQPYVDENNRTLVPLRQPMEVLGCTVEWDATTKTATISKNTTVLTFTVGKSSYGLNGTIFTMDTQTVADNGRVLIPIHYAVESFGDRVFWDDETQAISIKTSLDSIAGIRLGDGQNKIIAIMGEPISIGGPEANTLQICWNNVVNLYYPGLTITLVDDYAVIIDASSPQYLTGSGNHVGNTITTLLANHGEPFSHQNTLDGSCYQYDYDHETGDLLYGDDIWRSTTVDCIRVYYEPTTTHITNIQMFNMLE